MTKQQRCSLVILLNLVGNLAAQTHDHSQMDHSQVDHSQMHHPVKPKPSGVSSAPLINPETKVISESLSPLPAADQDHSQHAISEPSLLDHKQLTELSAERDPHAFSDGIPLPEHLLGHGGSQQNLLSLITDRLETMSNLHNAELVYDAQAWFGQTYDRALIRAEGEVNNGAAQNARSELLWAHAISPYWDSHLGIRYDHGLKPDRSWLALGVQGLAPYWVYVEATAYLGEQGRTAFRLELEYDLLITQKLILQPRIEANIYGKQDLTRQLGNGLADFEAGIRLRYELNRQFAPYMGVEWTNQIGKTAELQMINGQASDQTRLVAGVHFWF